MSNEEITARLMEPFPAEEIKTRPGRGGVALSYLEGATVIRRLIQATGNIFDISVLDLRERDNLVIALVEINIPEIGKRQHVGCARLDLDPDNAYKAAITSAIKKAATTAGLGLNLYFEDDTSSEPESESRSERGGYSGRGNGERSTARPGFRPVRQSA